MLKVLIVYWSGTGNTEKVAYAIRRGVEKEGVHPTFKKITEAGGEELYEYDLVCLGTPVYALFLPPKPILRFIRQKMKHHEKRGDIKPRAPKIPGKNAVVFCTYSGPHTGIREAAVTVKCVEQFFEHLGFRVQEEWYIVGEYHGQEELSTKGTLGDIRGRPSSQDLAKVENDTSKLVGLLLNKLNTLE